MAAVGIRRVRTQESGLKALLGASKTSNGLLLLLTAFLWCVALADWMGREPEDVSESILEGKSSWPFLFVGTVLAFQACFCAMVWQGLQGLSMAPDPGHGEMEFLSRMQQVLVVLALDSLVAAIHYLNLASTGLHAVGKAAWMPGASEPRLLSRYLLWAFLTPPQWVVYGRLCTTATMPEICSLVLMTHATMLLGYCASAMDFGTHPSEGVNVVSLIIFSAACLLCFAMFKRVMSFREEPATVGNQPKLKLLAFLWAAYPIAMVCRSFGLISVWMEQVVIHSFLDGAEKTVLCMVCSSGPLVQLLVSSLKNLRDSRSTHSALILKNFHDECQFEA
eukprot:gb/GFBE01077541.1/.p1 GENE.gb/GFBE01077541.1/~~gb/GFBE01077541.1/.p1  ORF type:complete len:335 (+),score=52.34 gb/GFBE01077541.1/:1-1005(+)